MEGFYDQSYQLVMDFWDQLYVLREECSPATFPRRVKVLEEKVVNLRGHVKLLEEEKLRLEKEKKDLHEDVNLLHDQKWELGEQIEEMELSVQDGKKRKREMTLRLWEASSIH
jgi:chromosome segregation ATPase